MKLRMAEKKVRLITWALLIIAVLILHPGSRRLSASGPVTIKIGGTGGALGSMKELGLAYQKKHPDTAIKIIPHLGTRGGIKAVLDGALDIGLAGRGLSQQELAQGLQEYEYARSPFVFVTGKNNQGMNLTLHMIAGIYRGDIRKWPDGTPLRLVMRPEGDIDTSILRAISPEMKDAVSWAESREGILSALDDQENCDKLEKIKGSFGTSTLTQIIAEKRSLTILPLNRVNPDIKAMVTGRYPYFRSFRMVSGPKSSPHSRGFIEFVKSREGMSILRRTGNHVQEVRR